VKRIKMTSGSFRFEARGKIGGKMTREEEQNQKQHDAGRREKSEAK
jgi:hypothetical protein